MKLSPKFLLCAASVTLACSHDSRPESVPTASTPPARTAWVTTGSATGEPGAPGIPTNNPAVPAPVSPAAPPAEATSLTPSAGTGAPRQVAGLVSSDPALDRAESREDQESIAEIRALMGAEKSLSPTARSVVIVARNGRVWLRGQVNTAEERAAIERAARKAANVRDVHNELVVLQ